MDFTPFEKKFKERIARRGGSVEFASGAKDFEIESVEKRLGLSIPPRTRGVFESFNGFEASNPGFTWYGIDRLRVENGYLEFAKADNTALAFDARAVNEANQWTIVNGKSKKAITLTVGSLLANKIWKWLDGRVGVFDGTEETRSYLGIWFFQADNCGYPVACFREKNDAEDWIRKNRMIGTLTKLPLEKSVFEWSRETGLYHPKEEEIGNPAFQGSFSSAYLEHHHYKGD